MGSTPIDGIRLYRLLDLFNYYMPLWRNWQTRWTQNPVPAREYGFDPHRRHILGSIDLVKARFIEFFYVTEI